MIQEKVNLLAREELLIRDVPQSDDFEWCMDIGEYHGEEKKHQADDRFASNPFLASGSQNFKRT